MNKQRATVTGSSRLARRLKKTAITLAVLALAITLYNTLTGHLAKRWDAAAPRDPDTGILIGAEELDLGPEDAPAAVLLVHGFVGGSNNFGELPQLLAADGYRVRAMRLPGHGTTPEDFAKTPASEFTTAVLRELRALKQNHERVYLVGHSMGGALSTIAAASEPVDGLILAAPYFGVTYQWYYILPAEVWTKLTAPLVHRVYKARVFIRVNRDEAKDDILSYTWIPAQGSVTLIRIGEDANDPEVLGAIHCPVLILHGSQDFAAAPKATQNAFDQMPSKDKTLHWHANSDHHLFYDYDREEVQNEILEFLRRLEEF